MRPSVPLTNHPALGLAKATAQKPLTPGNVNQVFPSSGVQAAAPVENVGGSLAGDHYGTTEIVSAAVTSPSNVTQPEYGAGNRRRSRKSPSSAAITRRRSARVIGITGIQIAAAHDPVVRIAEINGECAGAGRAKQRRIIRVPGVPLICGGQSPGSRRDACRYPRVPATLCCDASAA